jgi:hypothetical protein
MTAKVGEVALKVWDTLTEAYRRREGPQTISGLMRASALGRSEIRFGLAELAGSGWVWCTVTDTVSMPKRPHRPKAAAGSHAPDPGRPREEEPNAMDASTADAGPPPDGGGATCVLIAPPTYSGLQPARPGRLDQAGDLLGQLLKVRLDPAADLADGGRAGVHRETEHDGHHRVGPPIVGDFFSRPCAWSCRRGVCYASA